YRYTLTVRWQLGPHRERDIHFHTAAIAPQHAECRPGRRGGQSGKHACGKPRQHIDKGAKAIFAHAVSKPIESYGNRTALWGSVELSKLLFSRRGHRWREVFLYTDFRRHGKEKKQKRRRTLRPRRLFRARGRLSRPRLSTGALPRRAAGGFL